MNPCHPMLLLWPQHQQTSLSAKMDAANVVNKGWPFLRSFVSDGRLLSLHQYLRRLGYERTMA